MNKTISRGRLKNSRIQSAPGLISPNNCRVLLRRKNFTMGIALFRKNAGGYLRKRDGHFLPDGDHFVVPLHDILLAQTYFLTTSKPDAIMCISANINNILHATPEIISIFYFGV